MSQYFYNHLYVKAQLLASEDEFQVRCREAFETNQITEEEYKRLLAFRKEYNGSKSDPKISAKKEI